MSTTNHPRQIGRILKTLSVFCLHDSTLHFKRILFILTYTQSTECTSEQLIRYINLVYPEFFCCWSCKFYVMLIIKSPKNGIINIVVASHSMNYFCGFSFKTGISLPSVSECSLVLTLLSEWKVNVSASLSYHGYLTTLLARDAFVRVTRYCHDVRPSVHLSVRLSVCLGRACTVIILCTLARI